MLPKKLALAALSPNCGASSLCSADQRAHCRAAVKAGAASGVATSNANVVIDALIQTHKGGRRPYRTSTMRMPVAIIRRKPGSTNPKASMLVKSRPNDSNCKLRPFASRSIAKSANRVPSESARPTKCKTRAHLKTFRLMPATFIRDTVQIKRKPIFRAVRSQADDGFFRYDRHHYIGDERHE